MSEAVKVREVLTKTTGFFQQKGFESARLDAELVLAKALSWERMRLYLNWDYPLSDAELAACREIVKRRASGEPVAYILGRKDFFQHSFEVNKNVLIPRPETETLVERTLEHIKNMPDSMIRVIDLGTGSGCIGLSLAAFDERVNVLAVDISSDALEVARRNAETLGVSGRVTFLECDAAKLDKNDLQKAFSGSIDQVASTGADVIVGNPPYIAIDDPEVQADVRKFEPNVALFSDEGGFAHLRQWAAVAHQLKRPDAFVMFEMGCDQAAELKVKLAPYGAVEIVKDLAGKDRFVWIK
jgi:release factor glutamine methyltransferase